MARIIIAVVYIAAILVIGILAGRNVKTSEEFATRFLMEEKVAVVPGTAFGECGEGFLRISYAYSLENLKEALGRMQKFIDRLREEQKDK